MKNLKTGADEELEDGGEDEITRSSCATKKEGCDF